MVKYILVFLLQLSCASERSIKDKYDTKNDNINSCKLDTDCTIAFGVCEEQRAININFLKEFNNRIKNITEIIDCSTFRKELPLLNRRAKCISEKCILIQD